MRQNNKNQTIVCIKFVYYIIILLNLINCNNNTLPDRSYLLKSGMSIEQTIKTMGRQPDAIYEIGRYDSLHHGTIQLDYYFKNQNTQILFGSNLKIVEIQHLD